MPAHFMPVHKIEKSLAFKVTLYTDGCKQINTYNKIKWCKKYKNYRKIKGVGDC